MRVSNQITTLKNRAGLHDQAALEALEAALVTQRRRCKRTVRIIKDDSRLK